MTGTNGDAHESLYWLALLIAFFLGIHLSADQAIKISASPTVIAAQGSALLKVIVERNAMNRTLIWEVDGLVVLPEQHDAARELVGCAKLFLHAERSPRWALRCAPEWFAMMTPR